ncbi:MAG TPA: DsbA family protein [Candidatus Binataceae bacterium]|nr:DsbA family protein [Candidatus Binataceae bacterium]
MAAETLETLKFYYDFKSPFSYLALAPTLALERSHRVQIRFMPYAVDLKSAYGGELDQRTELHWAKVRYLYADARRFANDRGLIVRGPQKLFDSRLALMSGQYAADHGKIVEYAELVFERFFKRELDIENLDALCEVLTESGLDPENFRRYILGNGPAALTLIEGEAERDNIFGVPTLLVAGEPFWGNDRVSWAAKKLDAMGLQRAGAASPRA